MPWYGNSTRNKQEACLIPGFIGSRHRGHDPDYRTSRGRLFNRLCHGRR